MPHSPAAAPACSLLLTESSKPKGSAPTWRLSKPLLMACPVPCWGLELLSCIQQGVSFRKRVELFFLNPVHVTKQPRPSHNRGCPASSVPVTLWTLGVGADGSRVNFSSPVLCDGLGGKSRQIVGTWLSSCWCKRAMIAAGP